MLATHYRIIKRMTIEEEEALKVKYKIKSKARQQKLEWVFDSLTLDISTEYSLSNPILYYSRCVTVMSWT